MIRESRARIYLITFLFAAGFTYLLGEKALAHTGWKLWAALVAAAAPVLIAAYEVWRDAKIQKRERS